MNPKAKTNLLFEDYPDETLVYDLDRHRAHCLNPTAAFLLREADGTRDVAELTRMAEAAFEEDGGEDVIRLGLERLERARLVEWEGSSPAPSGPSRREAIRRLATVGLAIPAVMTVVSPLYAQGTGITPQECKTLEDIGNCCVNQKRCIRVQQGKSVRIRCLGARC